jgi:hypothetical protein
MLHLLPKLDVLFLTDIIIPYFVKVDKTHVVSSNLRHHFLTLQNLARKIVLSFATNVSKFKACRDPILRIFKAHLADQLMTHCAHHNVVKQIIVIGKPDSLAVLEDQQLVAI